MEGWNELVWSSSSIGDIPPFCVQIQLRVNYYGSGGKKTKLPFLFTLKTEKRAQIDCTLHE